MNTDNEKITDKISPLPWAAAYGSSGNFGIYVKNDIDRAITIPITHISPMERVNETDIANAKYIVLACNSYPELILENERLKSLNGELVEGLQFLIDDIKNKPNDTRYATAILKAKELINKAKQ